jgi:hypothetical protein
VVLHFRVEAQESRIERGTDLTIDGAHIRIQLYAIAVNVGKTIKKMI